jgi:hypothetical protein
MAKRIGTVLKFKEGVSREEAILALKSIKHLLDLPATVTSTVYYAATAEEAVEYNKVHHPMDSIRAGQKMARFVQRPLANKDMIHEYNDEHGEPVWYIP